MYGHAFLFKSFKHPNVGDAFGGASAERTAPPAAAAPSAGAGAPPTSGAASGSSGGHESCHVYGLVPRTRPSPRASRHLPPYHAPGHVAW